MRDDDRVSRVLGTPELAWIIDRCARRIEWGRPLEGVVSLADATREQRQAVAWLFGRKPTAGRSISVELRALDSLIRRQLHPGGLAEAVRLLRGEIEPRAERIGAINAKWQAALDILRDYGAERPELMPWVHELSESGIFRRTVRDPDLAKPTAHKLVAVVRALPAGGLPIGVLASRTLGSAHALDSGPVATLTLSSVVVLAPRDGVAPAEGELRPGEVLRLKWAQLGVDLDELSSRVLVLNLARLLRDETGVCEAAARAGEPTALTLRQIRSLTTSTPFAPPTHAAEVFVCENPVVVATAAVYLGADCPPLICVEGQPSAAAVRLLDLLHGAGVAIHYHGDFDWGGLRIAGFLYRRYGFTPWRYRATDYESAARARSDQLRRLKPLDVPSPWDPMLSESMTRRLVAVEEELVLGALLTDLG